MYSLPFGRLLIFCSMTKKTKNTITNTLEIANLGNKSHADVLRELRGTQKKICTKEYKSLWNISRYIDSSGRKCIMYNVTKKGWLLLLKGYEVEKKLFVINKCLEDDKKLQEKLKLQKSLTDRVWDSVDRNDLYKRVN